ncbi:MAG: NPCBM/NEW2 domain-containing protein [Chthoniobacteraceae bacterium]
MAKAQYQVDANTVTISPKELKELLLDEETPLSAKVGWGKYWANKFTEDRDAQILLDGRPCEHFIFPHANSSVTFAVPAGFTRFSAVGIGPTKKARREYSWTYQVLADEKSVYQSKRLDSYPGNKLPIEVELPPGTRTLTLITDIAGNGFADHSIWADPKLLRPPLSAETLAKLAQLEAQFRKASASAPASQLKKLQDNYDAQLASLAQSLAGKPAEADAVNAIRRRTSAMLPTTPAATK